VRGDADGWAIMPRTDLWQRLGLVDGEHDPQTRAPIPPRMLAHLLGVSGAAVIAFGHGVD